MSCATGAQSIALRFESETIFSPGNFFIPDYPGLGRIRADDRSKISRMKADVRFKQAGLARTIENR